MSIKIPFWIFVLAYLVAAFGTFGWVWNHTKGVDRCYVDNGKQHDCFTDYGELREPNSFFAGAFWPIYWGGVVALTATK